jgi:ankyrin repeat protein
MARTKTVIPGWKREYENDDLHYKMKHYPVSVLASIIKRCTSNFKDSKNRTILHIIAKRGVVSLAKLIIEKGFSVNAIDEDGEAPIHYSAYNDNKEMTEFLLSRGAHVDHKSKNGMTPLQIAAAYSHTEVVKTLLAAGADVDAQHERGRTALHWCLTYNGSKETIQVLLEHGANIRHLNNRCIAPLNIACVYGGKEAVELLLSKDIDPNEHIGGTMTPLESLVRCGIACDTEKDDMALSLIDHGYKPNFRGSGGNYAIHTAVEGNLLKTIDHILAQRPAHVNWHNKKNQTPLHIAVMYRNIYMINYLIAKGADINAKDAKGNTPLHYAGIYGLDETIMKLLLDDNADLHIRNNNKYTPLHIAALFKLPECCELLISNHAHQDDRYHIFSTGKKICSHMFEDKLLCTTECFEHPKPVEDEAEDEHGSVPREASPKRTRESDDTETDSSCDTKKPCSPDRSSTDKDEIEITSDDPIINTSS